MLSTTHSVLAALSLGALNVTRYCPQRRASQFAEWLVIFQRKSKWRADGSLRESATLALEASWWPLVSGDRESERGRERERLWLAENPEDSLASVALRMAMVAGREPLRGFELAPASLASSPPLWLACARQVEAGARARAGDGAPKTTAPEQRRHQPAVAALA